MASYFVLIDKVDLNSIKSTNNLIRAAFGLWVRSISLNEDDGLYCLYQFHYADIPFIPPLSFEEN